MKWVVDASVAVKWLAPELESLRATALIDDELIVPDLLFAELANVLWKKHLRGEMDAAAISASSRLLRQIPLHVHPCSEIMKDALELSIRLQHSAYDCFYLALAIHVDCSMVTADRKFFERCRRADATDLGGSIVML